MHRIRRSNTIIRWFFLVMCALPSLAFAQYKILCDLREMQPHEHGSGATHSHEGDHGSGHEHSHADAHGHSHDAAEHHHEHASTEPGDDANPEEECCDNISADLFSAERLTATRPQLDFRVLFAFDAPGACETLTCQVDGRRIFWRDRRAIPPPLSPHIPTTILRI